MVNTLLYAITVLIWGTTWFAISLQTGNVPAMVSVFYRFTIASVLLLGVLKITGRLSKITARDHRFCLLQGMCVFCFNFLCFYSANRYINSGLESVLFSMSILFNAVNGMIFLKQKITRRFLIAGTFGIIGIVSLFWQDLQASNISSHILTGIGLSLLGTYGFSLGNIISARNQKQGIDVLSANAYAMFYGALTMIAIIFVSGTSFQIDTSISYLSALAYLAVFGSVVGFGTYFTLVGRIGTASAAYATVLFPLVALGVSTAYEGYVWTESAVLGLTLILLGNIVMFYKPKTSKAMTKRIRAVAER
ncbi:EamA family transporter [Vibrio albus]|uniref:EamA family transporter n=1 Tax=Vibrio albus TaxID=2200953 RepID=A0A2U3BAL8_9VIBR|nr:DMT family transporter [Vibrio albus]PWI33827.1 EamA family transporter [Vibrio albus]